MGLADAERNLARQRRPGPDPGSCGQRLDRERFSSPKSRFSRVGLGSRRESFNAVCQNPPLRLCHKYRLPHDRGRLEIRLREVAQ